MSTATEILAQARQYGASRNLPYAGALMPQQAYQLLQADTSVKLIDVRTNAERDWVGRVILPSGPEAAIEWTRYPGGVPNDDFLTQLAQLAASHDVILFLCRSGVRSQSAATLAAQHGYVNCFDILEGFEGNKDQAGHRKNVGGWCHAGLPWSGA
jgi:rhodanese-related sulfurtransferase